jgi:hypothetical protein
VSRSLQASRDIATDTAAGDTSAAAIGSGAKARSLADKGQGQPRAIIFEAAYSGGKRVSASAPKPAGAWPRSIYFNTCAYE